MSRKVASLNPSSSRRERVRRCHSEIRNFSWYTMVAAFDGGLVSFADDGAALVSDQVGDAARGGLWASRQRSDFLDCVIDNAQI
jgi:hypothetical protein